MWFFKDAWQDQVGIGKRWLTGIRINYLETRNAHELRQFQAKQLAVFIDSFVTVVTSSHAACINHWRKWSNKAQDRQFIFWLIEYRSSTIR